MYEWYSCVSGAQRRFHCRHSAAIGTARVARATPHAHARTHTRKHAHTQAHKHTHTYAHTHRHICTHRRTTRKQDINKSPHHDVTVHSAAAGRYWKRLVSDAGERHVVDVTSDSFEAAAAVINGWRLHVLVDLDVWMKGRRPELLALRPAPVQASPFAPSSPRGPRTPTPAPHPHPFPASARRDCATTSERARGRLRD